MRDVANVPEVPADPIRGDPGFTFATTDRGHNLVGISDNWNWAGNAGIRDGTLGHYTYEPRISAPRGNNSTTEVHTGPQFRSRDIAQQYAEELLKGGKFGPMPDETFSAPFLARDASALRQLMAERTRSEFGIVPKPPEHIDWAAIKVGDKIFKGQTHYGAGERAAMELGVPFDKIADTATDGFLTTSGRFVGREEAGRIAQSTGQFKGLPQTRAADLHASEVKYPRTDLDQFIHDLKEP